MSTEEKNQKLGDHFFAQKSLKFEVSITGNATPASKTHSIDDVPGVALLRTEGKVTESDTVEDLSGDFTTAVDATNGQFGILIKGSETDTIKKVLKVTVTEQTSTSTAVAASPASSTYLTSGGNIAIDVLSTGTDLVTESPTYLVEVEYVKQI